MLEIFTAFVFEIYNIRNFHIFPNVGFNYKDNLNPAINPVSREWNYEIYRKLTKLNEVLFQNVKVKLLIKFCPSYEQDFESTNSDNNNDEENKKLIMIEAFNNIYLSAIDIQSLARHVYGQSRLIKDLGK
jgi:hypothetical protein